MAEELQRNLRGSYHIKSSFSCLAGENVPYGNTQDSNTQFKLLGIEKIK